MCNPLFLTRNNPMHLHYYSGSPTKKVPKRKATTEQDLDEMKAKIEDERKKLKDVKNMAEEEKNKIKFELKRQEDELAKVWILCFTFSLNPLRFFSHKRHKTGKGH